MKSREAQEQVIVWKDVKDYEVEYQVSNFGHVYSIKREKYIKAYMDKDGYLIVGLCKDSKQKIYKVHRLVAKAFIPNPENKQQVNHIDGDKTNNRVENLEWVTCQENIIHCHEAGLWKPRYGKDHHNFGKHVTEDTKLKMSKNRKGKLNANSKKVRCITTGEEFDYIRQASKKYNVAAESIGRNCKGISESAGKHPITNEKLAWEYVED